MRVIEDGYRLVVDLCRTASRFGVGPWAAGGLLRQGLTVWLAGFHLCALCPVLAETVSVAMYYPLQPGAVWNYRVALGGQTLSVVRTVVDAPASIQGRAAMGIRETVEGRLNYRYWFSNGDGIALHRLDQDEQALPAGEYFEHPLSFLPAMVDLAGNYSSLVNFATVPAGRGQPTYYSGQEQLTSQVQGRESVTVPAGTFDCLKVAISEGWSESGEMGGTAYTWWLAAGVGLVKQRYDDGTLFELASYSFPNSAQPTITRQPQDVTVTAGQDAAFDVAATGEGLSYQWEKDSSPLVGATAPRLTLPAVAVTAAGGYRVVVSNSSGAVTSRVATLTVTTPPASRPRLAASRPGPGRAWAMELEAAAAQAWDVEASTNLVDWRAMGSIGAGATTFSDAAAGDFPRRFYRLRSGGGTHPPAVVVTPVPGQLYPAGTTFGGDLFGVELTIPAAWKGGLKVNTPLLLFGSDTEPGLVIEATGFGTTRDALLADVSLREGFETTLAGSAVFFRPTDPAQPVRVSADDRAAAEFTGLGQDAAGNPVTWTLNLEGVLHPSGGLVLFLGITTAEYQARLKAQLALFLAGVKVTPRLTSTEYVAALGGRIYQWAGDSTDWYHGDYLSSASTGSWTENHAFFARDGTFEVNRKSTGYATSNVSTGLSREILSLSYDSTTREYGQWTVIDSPRYGNLLLLVTIGGYQACPIQLNADGSLYVDRMRLLFEGTF